MARVGRFLLLIALSCLSAPSLIGQESGAGPIPMPHRWLQGFVRPVSGEWIIYPWAYPGQTKTLLSRATDGRMAVEWEGEFTPAGQADEPVTYLWHAGTASGYGAHRFTFLVNGRVCASFTSGRTMADREWSVQGQGGATLSFKTTRVGTFNELFGFMWLTAPRSFFGTGAPRFSVVGEAANNQDYYLGPEEPVRALVQARPEEAVLAGGGRLARLEVSHIGNAAPAALRTGDRVLWSGTIAPGYTSVLVSVGPNAEMTLLLSVEVDGARSPLNPLALQPVRPRAIHLLPHSHIDIGYSDPQPDVERKQWKNLREAVEIGTKTASYPNGARFKWNVEGLWSVESYLKQASPDDRRAFVEAVRDGTIGLQANYTNILTGLATPEELRRWTDGARRLRAEYGFAPIRSAMHTDIPGLAWTSVAALSQSGVRYFSSGPNYMPGLPDGGDRIGFTLRALGDKPCWWASPSGEERLLFWMAGRGYSWFHGLNTSRFTDRSRDTVLDYVKTLVDRGYQWDLIQVRYTIGGDNGPVDANLPDVVKTWNEQFETPRLVINTVESLFAEFERRHGAALPVLSGDMTPYWEDGAVSSAAEESLARAAARRLAQAETLWALRDPTGFPFAQAADAWRSVILWHEHTWGAADSISQPDRPDVVGQWNYKRAFAIESDRSSRALVDAVAPLPGDAIEIVNTLSWPRSGLVFLSPERSRGGDRVSAGGRVIPSQRLKDGRLAVWAQDVPPLGTVRWQVERGTPGKPKLSARVDGLEVTNGRVGVRIDSATGSISRLSWRPDGDTRSIVLGPGQPPVADSGVGRRTPPAIGITWRSGAPALPDIVLNSAPLFDYLYVPGRDPSAIQRTSQSRITIDDHGPLVTTLRIESAAPGVRRLIRTVQVVAGSDTMLMEATLVKTAVRAKESAHIAFPLSVPGGVVRIDQGEALIEPERSQVSGSCKDFIGAHSAVDVSGTSVGVSVAMLDAPLVELGALTDERLNDRGTRNWRERVASGTTLYAYLLNNYWHTNYKADQEGPLRFRFAVRPHAAFDPVALRRFSEDQNQPLLVFAVDAASPTPVAPFTVDSVSVGVAALRPIDGGAALLVRLYNPSSSGASATIRPASKTARVFAADGDGAAGGPLAGSLSVPPFATRTIRIQLR